MPVYAFCDKTVTALDGRVNSLSRAVVPVPVKCYAGLGAKTVSILKHRSPRSPAHDGILWLWTESG